MGSRKHKKHHKSDKKDRIPEATTVDVVRPYVEQQPLAGLRLVLKVGGSSASEHGDSPHPEVVQQQQPPQVVQPPMSTSVVVDASAISGMSKHKKAKKKKKKKSVDKDREKPPDTKKHKHHHHHHHHDKKEKRKRDRDSMNAVDGDLADREYSIAEAPPAKHQILHGHHHHHHQQQDSQLDASQMDYGGIDRPFREPRACTLKNRQGKTALQHLLDYLLKVLERKDPHQFFAWPVTDNIAPGYSSIIARPMDFSTIKTKIDNSEYIDMDHFKSDIKLMCDNAMTYNRPDTIYFKSAKKLLHVSTKITSKEKLLVLRNTLTYINDLGKEELGFETEEPLPPQPPPPPQPLPTPALPSVVPPSAPQQPSQLPPLLSPPPAPLLQVPLATPPAPLQPLIQLQPMQPQTMPVPAPPPATSVDADKQSGSCAVAVVVTENIPGVETKKKPIKAHKFEDVSEGEEDSEDVSAQEIMAQAKMAAKAAADRLTLRRPNSKFGFLRQRNDGSTSLAILNPDGSKLPGKVERLVNLEMLVGKLTHGTGSIAGFKEDKRNIIKPVNYLNYGSFGSYAPSYDSTFANITKEESDMLYSTYGDETGVQYAESLLNFSRDCEFVSELADGLLNALTDGDHSRTNKVIETRKKRQEQEFSGNNKVVVNGKGNPSVLTNQAPVITSPLEFDFGSLRSLADEGIDISFLDNVEKELKRDPIQKKLDETSSLLTNLVKVQHARLSAKPPAHLSNVQGPSVEEIQLAHKVTDGLVELSKKAIPSDVIAPVTIHKAIGISGYSGRVSDLEAEEEEEVDTVAEAITAVATVAAEEECEGGYRSSTAAAVPSSLDAQVEKATKKNDSTEDAESSAAPPSTLSADDQTNDLEMELREFLETGPTLRVSDSPTQMDVSLDDVIS